MAKRKTSITPNTGEDAEKLDQSYIITWYSYTGEEFLNFLQINHAISFDPVIQLLVIYSREMKLMST